MVEVVVHEPAALVGRRHPVARPVEALLVGDGGLVGKAQLRQAIAQGQAVAPRRCRTEPPGACGSRAGRTTPRERSRHRRARGTPRAGRRRRRDRRRSACPRAVARRRSWRAPRCAEPARGAPAAAGSRSSSAPASASRRQSTSRSVPRGSAGRNQVFWSGRSRGTGAKSSFARMQLPVAPRQPLGGVHRELAQGRHRRPVARGVVGVSPHHEGVQLAGGRSARATARRRPCALPGLPEHVAVAVAPHQVEHQVSLEAVRPQLPTQDGERGLPSGVHAHEDPVGLSLSASKKPASSVGAPRRRVSTSVASARSIAIVRSAKRLLVPTEGKFALSARRPQSGITDGLPGIEPGERRVVVLAEDERAELLECLEQREALFVARDPPVAGVAQAQGAHPGLLRGARSRGRERVQPRGGVGLAAEQRHEHGLGEATRRTRLGSRAQGLGEREVRRQTRERRPRVRRFPGCPAARRPRAAAPPARGRRGRGARPRGVATARGPRDASTAVRGSSSAVDEPRVLPRTARPSPAACAHASASRAICT